jgi:hypothetical protein
MSSLGINYDNMPSPFYQGGSNYQEKGESNLFPYLAIRGAEIFDNDSSIENKSDGVDSISGGLNRFTLNISPLNQGTYPNYGSIKTLVNLDTAQLYAPNPKIKYTYGGAWEEPTPEPCSPYFTNKQYGVYQNPTPIRGAPVEFKKVYFRGKLVDKEKGYVLDSESGKCRTFHAVFACSNPIEQTIYQEEEDCDEPSGTLYNPRDENFSHSNYATERSWEEIDIFCGEGGSGSGSGECFEFNVGRYNASNSGLYETGSSATGCDTCGSIILFSGDGVTLTNSKGIAGDDSGYCGTLLNIPGPPNFTASGCLDISKNTETNTVTYGIDRAGMLECLGYIETGFRVLMPTGTGLEMPTGFNELQMCEFQMLYKCPQDDMTYITGCCADPVGACCASDGTCSLQTSEDCAGRFWGLGTNCTDIISVEGPTNYFYNFTISQLCQRGTACLYDSVAQAYECAEIMGSNVISREEYYQLLATDNYNPDQVAGGANPSIFTQGATTCDCPTTTSTSTSSTSTSTTTTTTSTTTAEGGGGGEGGGGDVYGCTDPMAMNYNPNATYNDGSCVY